MCRTQTEQRHVWRGSNIPNDVAACLDPVVQEGQASIGDEIGKTHVVWCIDFECETDVLVLWAGR